MLEKEGQKGAMELADYFCREARVRIEQSFSQLYGPNDRAMNAVSKHVLAGEHTWIEQGIVGLMTAGVHSDARVPKAVRRETAGVS
jgi:hypothetical protein